MENEYLNQNVGRLISSARPYLSMPDEVKAQILSKLINSRAEKINFEWGTILGSRIARTAVAAAVIIVAFVGLSYWPGSIDPASTAFAAVKEAMLKMPCVHILVEGNQEQKNYRRECWLSFESGTRYEKFADGTISSIAIGTRKKLVYHPDSGKITVSYYQADDGEVAMDSSGKLLSGFLADFDIWNAKVTLEKDQYEGVDVYHAELPETKLASGAGMTGTMELMVDSVSRLPISGKLSGRGAEGTLLLEGTLTFDYPENDIKDIYALGVPESAEMVSNVPDAQTKIVLDRLDSRVKRGFGNSVAVLTESIVNDDRSLSKRSLQLFGQKGNSLLCARYPLNRPNDPLSDMISVQSWPQPNINEVLTQAKNARPAFLFVGDGTEANAQQFALSSQVWPIPCNLGFDKREMEEKATLLSSDVRPQEIGLNFDIIISERVSADSGFGRSETIYWIDPVCDDIITEKIERFYKPDRRSIAFQNETRYLDYAQTSDGQWYPARWQTTISDQDSTKVVMEYNLKIYSEMVLDDGWFTDFEK